MSYWTTDELIAAVKRRCGLPSGENPKISNAEFLAMAYDVLLTRVDPILTTLREEYGIARVDVAVTPDEPVYTLPERAVSGTIRQVLCVQGNGQPYPLRRLHEADAWQYEGNGTTATLPVGFVLEDDTLRLLPTPSQAVTLRVSYRRRPAQLVYTSACAVVTGWDANTLVIYATGGTWIPGPADNVIDVVRAKPPFGTLAESISTAYSVSSFQGPFVPSTFDRIAVGDYVAFADTTCIVPVPERYHTLLRDLVAAQALVEWGSPDAAAAVNDQISTYVASLQAAQVNRVEASPQIVVAKGGALRGGFGGGWLRR